MCFIHSFFVLCTHSLVPCSFVTQQKQLANKTPYASHFIMKYPPLGTLLLRFFLTCLTTTVIYATMILIPKFDHITPVLIGLHWLPVKYRVIFKILLLVYKAIHANAPPYLSDLLTPLHVGWYSLRSNEQNLLIVPKTMRKTFGDRAFAKAGPFLWNELPTDIVKRQQWKLLKTDLRPFSLKRHFILKYISN